MTEPPQEQSRIPTGVVGLDHVLAGGLIADRIYLVEGDPGTGKTTLALQYLIEGARRGEKSLYITLSERAAELEATARSHGLSLEGIDFVESITGEEELAADGYLTMYHPSEVELSAAMKSILAAVERVNPARVALDSLAEIRLLSQDSLRYRRQILALKQFFVGRHCTVVLLDDRAADGPDMQLRSIVHGVISLQQLAPAYGAERRRLRVIKFRGTRYRGGYHDFSIRRGGVLVFPRLVAAEHGRPFECAAIASGISALDDLLGGGPHRGTSTLLIGPAGSGKSTIALQYASAAAQRGDHAAIFAFDESVATLRARAGLLGIPLVEGSGAGEVRIRQIDPSEVSPGEFVHVVRESVEKFEARVVVIDSLNGFLHAMPEERFLTPQLFELLSYLRRQGTTVLLVMAQQGIIGDVQSSIEASYLADSVVLLRYFEVAGRLKKAISVVKKRSGPHEETIRELRLDGGGLHLGPPLTQFQGVLTGIPTLAFRGEDGGP